eukprot:jgi/Ulvmu1/8032/UM004_0269.1
MVTRAPPSTSTSVGWRVRQVARAERAHTARAILTQATAQSSSLTERIFEDVRQRNAAKQAGGAGGATTYAALQRLDQAWHSMRHSPSGSNVPEFVTESRSPLPSSAEFDVIICGGTLGIFLATALQLGGVKVAVLERGKLAGRAQEWNIARSELQQLIDLGVMTADEVEAAIAIEWHDVRMGFKGGPDVWTSDVLNLGVSPAKLIETVKQRFEAAGGTIIDEQAAGGAVVHPDGVALRLPDAGPDERSQATCRLLLDCMGHASPIVRQVRRGEKPDGVCCVVGTLASGFPEEANTTSDLIYTNSGICGSPDDASSNIQYFWEAFPAGAGPTHRTTYLFSYLDAEPSRPSLESMLEDYWQLMPEYQAVPLEQLQVERILFGFFPTFRASPLPPGFDRVMQVGDASGIQSPLSFGGFGALTRHLERLTEAITGALKADALDRGSLARINGYNPGLSSAWMLQRAMSVRVNENIDRDQINRMLSANFNSMAAKGDDFMKPFLQDVIQCGPFAQTVIGQVRSDPAMVPALLKHVGPVAMADWIKHFSALFAYDTAWKVVKPFAAQLLKAKEGDPKELFKTQQWLRSLQYGSGNDHHG